MPITALPATLHAIFMKTMMLLLGLFCSTALFAQTDEAAIRALMAQQTAAWNRGDLEGFMQTYWKSDSLLFVGKSGPTRGWQATLDNYKRGYPNTAAMGQLNFNLLEFRRLSADHYFVVGKWMLQRTAGNLSGHFTLLLRRFGRDWKIVADHSS
ncbi:YybH family protein [Pseudocnuella soli]|uniref:YybH family protein n=1 Tax=Pseudocnuella soli TaxID=2502779 RepID=UPI001F00A007|nr:nuclear transport factor 2 family protein [Pseudocnuella soli]